MDDLLFYLISSSLFLAIIYEAMGIFFNKKDVHCFISAIVWGIFYAVEILGTQYISMPILRLLFDIVSSFFLCIILYYGSIRKRLIWILVINLLGMITETIVGCAFIIVGVDIGQTEVLGSFVSKIVLLIILIGLKISNHSRLKIDISLKYWSLLFCIPVGSIFVLNTLFSLCAKIVDKNASVCAMLSSAFILGVNFIVFHIYESLSDRMEIQKQQIVFNKQIEMCKNQIQEREESSLNIRNIKHDIENHLICIGEYMDRNDLAYARKYIDELLVEKNYFQTASVINSGNVVVDALLNYKYIEMQELGIKIKTHIEIPYDIKINDADICIILGNCLDNSIEAVRKIDEEQFKIINVELIYRKDSLIFTIMNPFRGILKKDAKGEYITTKKDYINHGIGLSSVKRAVHKYDGLLETISEDGFFKVRVLLYTTAGENYI